MSKKTILAAGTSPFAHLLSGAAALAGRKLGSRAETEDEAPDGEGDDDDIDAEDEGTEPKGRKAKGRKAEEPDDADAEDDDADAEDEGDDADAEDDEPEPKGKKASGYDRGYAAANKRARAIFASPAAAGRPDLAAQLAFETNMTSAEAIGVLGMAGASTPTRGRSLDERMNARQEARPGAGASGGEKSFADQVLAASKKAGRR